MGNLGVFSVWSGKRLQAWLEQQIASAEGSSRQLGASLPLGRACIPPPSGHAPPTCTPLLTNKGMKPPHAVAYTSVTVIVGSTRLTNVHLVLFIASVKYEDFVSYVLITILNVLHKSIYKVYKIKVLWHTWPINSVLWLGMKNKTLDFYI